MSLKSKYKLFKLLGYARYLTNPAVSLAIVIGILALFVINPLLGILVLIVGAGTVGGLVYRFLS